jgi:peptidyl-prolyl cis-trans isomerase SurA
MKRFTNNVVWASILAFMAMNGLQAQDTVTLDKIIAKVGGEVIFHSEVAEQMAMMRERKMMTGKKEQCTILESFLAQAMLVHYAKIDSVELTEDEVEAEIDNRMNQILAMMNNDRKLFQDYYGQTVSEMRELVREDLNKQMLRERMQQQIMAKVEVTPSEVLDFFNTIPKDSLPYFNAEVELAEIVIFPEINEEEKGKALDKIGKIKEELKAGGDFAALARKYSEDGSARDGGDLGWTTRGSFVPEFEAAAFQLEVNEISDIVETEYGYHIIQLLERRGNSIHSRHILVRPHITEADRELTRNELLDVKRQLEDSLITFSDAVRQYGDKRVQSYSNNGRMINPKTNNTFFETGDVDSDVFFAIDTIEVGDITPPLEYRTPLGDYSYKIVQLQGRSTPHQANLKQDYSRIQDAARESKRNQVFSEWVDDHIPNTYIMIDPAYKDCEKIERWQPKYMTTRGQGRS